MKPHLISTRTPETPKHTKEELATGKTTSPGEISSESPELHPYLADILCRNDPDKELLHKMREEHRKEKSEQS